MERILKTDGTEPTTFKYYTNFKVYKDKDLEYETIRKSLTKITSLFNKLPYISNGAYGELNYRDGDDFLRIIKNKERTRKDYDFRFFNGTNNFYVNFNKGNMDILTTIDIETDEFDVYVKNVLNLLRKAVKEIKEVGLEKSKKVQLLLYTKIEFRY